MMKYFIRSAMLMLAMAMPAAAQDFEKASMAMCEKVKTCTLEQMGQRDLTPEMRQMMEPMLKTMGVSWGFY